MAPDLDAAERLTAQAREHFGPFLRERVNAGAAERDRLATPLPADLMFEAASLGLLTLPLPREYGGAGLDLFSWGITLEEVARGCEELAFVQAIGAAPLLARLALEANRPELIRRTAAWAYSDDADAFQFRSRADPEGSGWRLQGDKPLVTGALTAEGAWCYLAGPDRDLRVFWVERDDPGVEVVSVDSSGLRSSGLARLHLRGVRVGAERLLVERDGVSHAQRYLNLRRVTLSITVVGLARGMLERGVALLARTERGGRRLTEQSNVQATLGKLQAQVWSAQALARSALLRFAQGRADLLWDAPGSAAKYGAVECGLTVARTLARVLGGRAYLTDLGFERQLRDLEGLVAGAGAQDLLEVDLGVWASSAAAKVEGRP